MPKPAASPAEAVYARVSAVALALPGAEVKLSHGSPWFHVRGKMFLAFIDDHHGDGRLGVWCKADMADQRRLVAGDGARFYVPPYVGVKGWVGVRLDGADADWIELAILVEDGWRAIAPRRIADGEVARTAKTAKTAKALRLPRTDPVVAQKALERFTAICTALPEAAAERSASHASFRVGKRTFAYFLDNHHGDEKVAACLKAAPGENAALARRDPERFYIPEYLGSKGWVAVRLDTAKVDWKDVTARVTASYASVAPKRLVPPSGRQSQRSSL
jgi:hypothetical protein